MKCQLIFSLFVPIYYTTKGQPLAGTDDLGRTLQLNGSIGNLKAIRHLALFYFLWQKDQTVENYPDLSENVANHPEVLQDYSNEFWEKPVYKPGGPAGMYFWAKPIYGYYRGDDYWVHLRLIRLLTDANLDLDLLVINATNTLVYPKQANELMNALDVVRAQEKNPLQIVFYTNTSPAVSFQKVYDNFYKQGAPYYHPDCWFYLDGKPLIIGTLKIAVGKDYQSFFTLHESQGPNEPHKVNVWPSIEFTRPQYVYLNEKGEREIVNVSGCQHSNPTVGMGGSAFCGNGENWGRSYRNGPHGNPAKDITYGYNFQEQLDFALKPAITYTNITGRNDFHFLKIARDQKNIWFCAETTAAMTPNSGDNWMRLYLDMDPNPKTGWLGYDYDVVGGNKLQEYVSGKWADFQKVNLVVEGNKLVKTLPSKQLIETCHRPDFEFKWSDNMQNDVAPIDWYVNGDVVSWGRCNFIYTAINQ